jgi:hypothetical protein
LICFGKIRVCAISCGRLSMQIWYVGCLLCRRLGIYKRLIVSERSTQPQIRRHTTSQFPNI